MEELGFLRYGAFTGLGVLLSDQCPFTIRAAVFRDSDLMEFQDRREFSGPLFEQIEKCYAFLTGPTHEPHRPSLQFCST